MKDLRRMELVNCWVFSVGVLLLDAMSLLPQCSQNKMGTLLP
jgi:hypothetical protein